MKPRSILVVDDQPQMLHAIERVLSPLYRVAACGGPAEGLAAAQREDFDLALLDVQMPEMSGFQLMERLKQIRPALDVIFITGSVNEIDTQLVRAIEGGAFYFVQKPFDRKVLLTLVGRCLDLRRLERENRVYTQRLEQELTSARCFQRSLLPPPRSHANGLAIDVCYESCEALGGDLYDYVRPAPGELVTLIADVSGHGVSAAMLTAMVKSAFHAAQADGYRPLAIVQRVWDGLRPFGAFRFITAICTRFVQSEGRFEYVNAGHPAGILRRNSGEVDLLESSGPLISVAIDEPAWELVAAAIRPGDELLTYTDGIEAVEAPGGDMFGSERVVAAAQAARGQTPLADQVMQGAQAFAAGSRPNDDLTAMSVRVRPG